MHFDEDLRRRRLGYRRFLEYNALEAFFLKMG